MALNHVSRLCRNVKESIDFYTKSKDEDRLPDTDHLDPMDNHISFQCEDMGVIEKRLKEFNIKYMKRTVEDDESGTAIDQLFFNDPDGFMIEICNCENLKLVPAGSFGPNKAPIRQA
ncbi:hypothetical protein Pint_23872 [Pistacia integerrima]|uniref:Uncharacterized protein n=1 Tax=Pistacia integerrima TaxID=434235 RepID=A0ACC0YLT3_9ROSI|nr:hypothetical protein Pint_23872 [Pistacia integerrima]